MRIRWRNLELPNEVKSRNLTPTYGEFIVEPFERGFGRTIGNSLRRVLLSAIEGCAVTSVKIEGVKQEFSSMENVLEDVPDIIIQIKKLRIKINDDIEDPIQIYIDVEKEGEVTGADIKTEGKAEIVNKDLVIATITKKRRLRIDMEVKRGRGYITAEENTKEPHEIGVIPVASIFSPVTHVKYWIEDTRVGKLTNYDRLIMAITTDGTITPERALVEASKILRKHLNPFIQYFKLGNKIENIEEMKSISIEEPKEEEKEKEEKKSVEKNIYLDQPIDILGLKIRALNCLSSEGIKTIRELVQKSEEELIKIRNFGRTSLKEVQEKLKKYGLKLGAKENKNNN